MLYLGAMIGFFYFTTQYLQGVLGYSPLQAGVGFGGQVNPAGDRFEIADGADGAARPGPRRSWIHAGPDHEMTSNL
jgi:hypothetical protein